MHPPNFPSAPMPILVARTRIEFQQTNNELFDIKPYFHPYKAASGII